MYKGSPFSTFLPTLVVSCLFDIAFLTGVRWYLTVVLICVSMMLNVFSCACWCPYIFIWKNVYSYVLPIFKIRFFCYWVWWILYVFFVLTSYQIHDFESFLPFHKLPFHFGLFPLLCRSFLVWWHLTCFFCSCYLCVFPSMCFWFLCCKLIDHLCVSLFLGSVFH